jgi:hypothetical protein
MPTESFKDSVKCPPAVARHRLQVEYLKPHLLRHDEDALFFHVVVGAGSGPAALRQRYLPRAHLFELQDERPQRVVVRRAGRRVDGIEVGLENDRLSLYRVYLEQFDGFFGAFGPVAGAHEVYPGHRLPLR